METFGNCQRILEYAARGGMAGKWKYALFTDVVHYLGEESDEDDWPGYPETITFWEPEEDQDGAFCVTPSESAKESLERLDPARAAHKASLDRVMREADATQEKLTEDAEKAKMKKVKPWELTSAEKKKERQREKAEEERWYSQRYEALKNKGHTDEEIVATIAADREKKRKKEALAAKRKQSEEMFKPHV